MLPGLGRLGRFDVGCGQQVVVEGSEHLPQGDTAQHEGVPADPAPHGQQHDHRRRGGAADDRTRPGDQGTGGDEHQNGEQATRRRAPRETDDVGAAQRVAGDALEDRARHPEHATDDDRPHHPRQPLLENDEGGQILTPALEHIQEHVEGHRIGSRGQ